MNMRLDGKLALITGSSRGIGLSTARGLAQLGAEIILNGKDSSSLHESKELIQSEAKEAKVSVIAENIASASGCQTVIDSFPEVDILVNNMAIFQIKPFFELSDDDWAGMFEANVMSGIRLTRHYLNRMIENKDWGRVVFISSESGVLIPKEMVHYGFSKGAQLAVARGAAEYTKGTNITVNSVLPGPTFTERVAENLPSRAEAQGLSADEFKKVAISRGRPSSLLQRYAGVQEVANMICYICSPASSATNGAALRVDGGVVTNPF
jgi:NAD(P)-dependent dehydrogenase (short-subunit alcohol dehydrogenase family)